VAVPEAAPAGAAEGEGEELELSEEVMDAVEAKEKDAEEEPKAES